MAFVETIGQCSICRSGFNECEHIEGYIYMGRLCRRINRKPIKIDHSAIVENPCDKRCIINSIVDDDGNKIDYMTLKTLEKGIDMNDENIGSFEAYVMRFSKLDFD